MSKIEDFKARERVHHVMIGDGTVTAVDEAGVHVRFDHTRGKDAAGKPRHVEGVYDKRWFALNPEGYLFHRTKKLERDEQASTKGNPKTG